MDDTKREINHSLLSDSLSDPLTGIPNRLTFYTLLENALKRAKERNYRVTLILLNIDHLKNINRIFGYVIGDQLLQALSQRLARILRKTDALTRVGGDEFGIILEGSLSAEYIHGLSKKILEKTAEPFMIMKTELNVTACLGLTTYPDFGSNANQLINQAEHALHISKQRGFNTYHIPNASFHYEMEKKDELEKELREALKKNEIIAHYQPKINLQTGALVGVEALARWKTEKPHRISPERFISLYESMGLIEQFNEQMLAHCCRVCEEWCRTGLHQPTIPMAVNLSVRQFEDDQFVSKVKNMLAKAHLPASLLELEITENSLLTNPEKTVKIIKELNEMGIQFSIDDFGTGYSSLNYLKFLPIKSIKIDRTFIRDIHEETSHAIIVKSIIQLAHDLKMNVIAEGVETENELAFLKQYGCDEVQGYYFSPPLSEEDFKIYARNDALRLKLTV